MLSEDFDQTTDTVYEVWNFNTEHDPLVGIFDDEGKADNVEFEQTLDTGGGQVVYYPPIDRYVDKPPEARARTLLSEAVVRQTRINDDLGDDVLPLQPLHMLDDDLPDADVDLSFDRSEFEAIIDEVAWNDNALEMIRLYRTFARIRHLSVYPRDYLLALELDTRHTLGEINEMPE